MASLDRELSPDIPDIAVRSPRTTVVAVDALVTAQFVMLLMPSTPVHGRGHDQGLMGKRPRHQPVRVRPDRLRAVAGWVSDRFGPFRAALTGVLLVALSGGRAAVAPPAGLVVVSLALFGLGLGWGGAFVANSSLPARTGVRLQGRDDGLGWAFAAVVGLLSGLLLSSLGYPLLC